MRPDDVAAVLFDLDGVITDTAEAHYQAWQALADELGVPFGRDDNDQLRGVSRAESLTLILGDDHELSDEDFQQALDHKNRLYREKLEDLTPSDTLPGAVDAIVAARARGLAVAIVSSSRNTDKVVEQLGIGGLFDAIVDGNDGASKPAPDLFLVGAERVGIDPGACLVLEDAASGAEAGIAAGMQVIGVGPQERFAALDTDLVVADLHDLTWLLGLDRTTPQARVRDDEGLQLRGGWSFGEVGFEPGHEQQLGSNHMVGNGYLGYRGSFSEWRGEDGWVACVVSDTYDTADGVWRELTTSPIGLHGWWEAGGRPLTVPFDGTTTATHVEREYDLRHARSRRTSRFEVAGAAVTIDEERFAHLERLHVVAQRHRVTADEPLSLAHRAGIDRRVWSLNGTHLPTIELTVHAATEPGADRDVLVAVGTTVESGVTLAVAQVQVVSDGTLLQDGAPAHDDDRLLRRGTGRAGPGSPLVVDTFHVVYSSNDVEDPVAAAVAEARAVAADGWDALLTSHALAWQRVWDRADVVVDGDLLAQTGLRFNVLHQVLCTPRHDESLPIGARGLSCQVYQGAAFWDQEVFNLPMWLHTEPRVARQLLHYRIATLDGARRKARRLGYDGAFFAWVSGDTGDELCPSFFFVDVLTGRPIRNHFNDWQIHVSPDIAVAVRRYVAATGDTDLLVEGGAELVAEIARFCTSRASVRADTGVAHVLRVLGPDEYHENVDDNAFTNHLVHAALAYAVAVMGWLAAEHADDWSALCARIGLDDEEVARWDDVREHLVLPTPDAQTGIVEQFAGFHELEDVRPDDLRDRLQHPEEYWGWPNGVAVHTQVSKQADVVQLFVQLPERFDDPVVRATNHDHYLPRTQHGSSLSRSAYAIGAAAIGRPDEAVEHLLASSTVDLLATSAKTSGGTFIGGIRTAAAGGSWMAVAHGLLGLRVTDDGVALLSPSLPSTWQRLSVRLEIRGARVTVEVDADGTLVTADDRDQPALLIAVDDGPVQPLSSGGSLSVG